MLSGQTDYKCGDDERGDKGSRAFGKGPVLEREGEVEGNTTEQQRAQKKGWRRGRPEADGLDEEKSSRVLTWRDGNESDSHPHLLLETAQWRVRCIAAAASPPSPRHGELEELPSAAKQTISQIN